MSVYVNRPIDMKKIKAIGFDMDYTLVRYNTKNFEELTYKTVQRRLVTERGYSSKLLEFEFEYDRVIQGLVIDKSTGNILKLSRFGKVKTCYYGYEKVDFKKQRDLYDDRFIDLADNRIQSLDTSFAISHGILYKQLVELKKRGEKLPSFEKMAIEVKEVLDLSHRDGSLKNVVAERISDFIIQDKELPPLLEAYKRDGKKLLIITNSDFKYTKLLMDYAFQPFLKEHKTWMGLFEYVITLSKKPAFFKDAKLDFLNVDLDSKTLTNMHGDELPPGIYQGGFAGKLEEALKVRPSEVLYIGDHIYGDVVKLKKTFHWRTAMVLSPLEEEVASIKMASKVQNEIDQDMHKKELLEKELHGFHSSVNREKDKDRNKFDCVFKEIEKLNIQISENIIAYQKHFNPYWGELMRSGQEESLLAGQVEKYACIYVTKLADLFKYSPKSYFRPVKRIMPHEIKTDLK